jgi:hypothetical protein
MSTTCIIAPHNCDSSGVISDATAEVKTNPRGAAIDRSSTPEENW